MDADREGRNCLQKEKEKGLRARLNSIHFLSYCLCIASIHFRVFIPFSGNLIGVFLICDLDLILPPLRISISSSSLLLPWQFLRILAFHWFMTLTHITLTFTLWLYIHINHSNHTPAAPTTPAAPSPPSPPLSTGEKGRPIKTLLPLRNSRRTSASTASCPCILFCCW